MRSASNIHMNSIYRAYAFRPSFYSVHESACVEGSINDGDDGAVKESIFEIRSKQIRVILYGKRPFRGSCLSSFEYLTELQRHAPQLAGNPSGLDTVELQGGTRATRWRMITAV
jgi:hypothetical protein